MTELTTGEMPETYLDPNAFKFRYEVVFIGVGDRTPEGHHGGEHRCGNARNPRSDTAR